MLSLEQGALSFVYVHGHDMYSVWVVDVCTCEYTRTVGSGMTLHRHLCVVLNLP